jgi:hypothetical protein
MDIIILIAMNITIYLFFREYFIAVNFTERREILMDSIHYLLLTQSILLLILAFDDD